MNASLKFYFKPLQVLHFMEELIIMENFNLGSALKKLKSLLKGF